MILLILNHVHLEEHIERCSEGVSVFSGGVCINF